MIDTTPKRATGYAAHTVTLLLLLTAGLALSRLLYEGLFPRLLWLARPLPTLGLSLAVALLGWAAWRWAARHPERSVHPTAFLPLLLNALFLFEPAVDLVGSRFLFGASVWATAVLAARQLARYRAWRWLGVVFLLAALLPVYLLTMPHTVGRADTFEFQVVAPQLGIAHPTGYPLYLLLGKLFTLIPLDSVAWRLNFASTVYALLALTLLYWLGMRLLRRPCAALLGAVALGLTPAFWSQAIEAEVYALHALFVAGALLLDMRLLDDSRAEAGNGAIVGMAFWLGLGLTNHLTTLFLLPPAVAAVLLGRGAQLRQQDWRKNVRLLAVTAVAFSLPLLIYAYLPLRWQAVVGEPMGAARFVDWIIGGRFQGALQLTAWLNDPTRYAVVGRLFLSSWGWANLALAALGLIYLFVRSWRAGLVTVLAWAGFTFYALNYYVPDLAVFLIPAHVIVGLWLAAGITALLEGGARAVARFAGQDGAPRLELPLANGLLLLAALPTLLAVPATWASVDRAQADGLTAWGWGVLNMPLAEGAAILADSEKIAPLYYLQQAEGVRPDLDIMVLPDEAAYRAELDARIAAGQTVYLARFLPGLQGIYHLRSVGPLIEVSTLPTTLLPATVVPTNQVFGRLRLMGYALEQPAAIDTSAAAITLYWQATAPTETPQYVYVRWRGADFVGAPIVPAGQHPAANYYPTVAWEPGEIVSDYHLLPLPIRAEPLALDVEVAVGPPFAPADALTWQTVASMTLPPAQEIELAFPLRAQVGDLLLRGATFPAQSRPQSPLPAVVGGYGAPAGQMALGLQSVGRAASRAERPAPPVGPLPAFADAREVGTDVDNGRYALVAEDVGGGTAVCGWLARPTTGCALGNVEISGVPLPEGATNFNDKIALLAIDVPNPRLTPGGQLAVNLTWQSLSPLTEDYTVFLQVLNDQDQIVGQVDAWPVQGTYPTSQWTPGEIVEDPHLIQLGGNLPPGEYRLQVGWYLLATLQRLPVLDAKGQLIDDKVVVPGLVAPPP